MKNYKVTVEGNVVGVTALTAEQVIRLNNSGVIVEEVQ
jgi:hypothetical protein